MNPPVDILEVAGGLIDQAQKAYYDHCINCEYVCKRCPWWRGLEVAEDDRGDVVDLIRDLNGGTLPDLPHGQLVYL